MTDQSPERVEDERRLFEAAERRLHPRLGSDPEPDFGRTRTDGIYYIVAREHRWQGWLARASIQPVVTEGMVARIICHYDTPSDLNSCCPVPMGEKKCQVKARAILSELHQPGSKPPPHGERVDG